MACYKDSFSFLLNLHSRENLNSWQKLLMYIYFPLTFFAILHSFNCLGVHLLWKESALQLYSIKALDHPVYDGRYS
jgi:hypothetical protein